MDVNGGFSGEGSGDAERVPGTLGTSWAADAGRVGSKHLNVRRRRFLTPGRAPLRRPPRAPYAWGANPPPAASPAPRSR